MLPAVSHLRKVREAKAHLRNFDGEKPLTKFRKTSGWNIPYLGLSSTYTNHILQAGVTSQQQSHFLLFDESSSRVAVDKS